MIHYTEQKMLNFSQQQLFDLVADVESYPQFLPWCKAVRHSQDHELSNHHRRAEVAIRFGPFQASYTCHVTQTPLSEITVTLVEGPLKILHTVWTFAAIDAGKTNVSIDLKLAMKSFFLQKAVETVFNDTARQMMQAFENRAHLLYKSTHNT